ncbi:MAG TPA: pyrrolo-quinoline quinone [Candidatus Sulfotelmatobacter sp.]|jgi:hypothetical protein|nr:pyrrolo-quinoline quinone [Candidatus Sulfotelmatobacter sp.]
MKTNRIAGLSISVLVLACTTAAYAQVNVTTYHNDNGRTGQNLQETILTTSNVNTTTFGKLFSQTIDGYPYSQPLYLSNVSIPNKGSHNVVYVTTMNDSVYAFDADNKTGSNAQPLWKVNFTNSGKGITAVPESDVNCPDVITTQIGIMSTPVIDSIGGTIFVLARTLESGKYFHRLHALDVTSGAEKFGGPIAITASVPGKGNGAKNGMISFNPQLENQRSALLYQNGLVYVSWASLCDFSSYHGWVMAYSAQTLAQTAVWLTTANGKQGGIWQSGDGPAGDSTFNTFITTGNGTFDANVSGGIDYGQSVVKAGPPAADTLPVLDYFTPFNALTYNTTDLDIGSSGLVLLPDQTGPHKHLLVQSDKAGDLYLINRDNMGKFNAGSNSQIVQSLTAVNKGMWSSPAWWNNFVYLGGQAQPIQAFTFNPTTGLLSTAPTSKTSTSYGYPGTTVSISANQTSNGILWALNNSTYKNASGNAVLNAYMANNLGKRLYVSTTNAKRDNPGGAVKFQVPTVVNGKVYVATQKSLAVYGLLN